MKSSECPLSAKALSVSLFGAHNRDGWGVGLTILTALANLLPALPEDEAYLAIFHGARRVAADCDGQPPRRERTPLESRPEPATLKRWLRRWTKVRHREAAERTLLTAIAEGLSPAALANALLAAVFANCTVGFGNRYTLDQNCYRGRYPSTPSASSPMIPSRGRRGA
jgi:hypothetical protein